MSVLAQLFSATFKAAAPPPPPAGIVFTLSIPGSYTAPAGDNVNLVLTGPYVPPPAA